MDDQDQCPHTNLGFCFRRQATFRKTFDPATRPRDALRMGWRKSMHLHQLSKSIFKKNCKYRQVQPKQPELYTKTSYNSFILATLVPLLCRWSPSQWPHEVHPGLIEIEQRNPNDIVNHQHETTKAKMCKKQDIKIWGQIPQPCLQHCQFSEITSSRVLHDLTWICGICKALQDGSSMHWRCSRYRLNESSLVLDLVKLALSLLQSC